MSAVWASANDAANAVSNSAKARFMTISRSTALRSECLHHGFVGRQERAADQIDAIRHGREDGQQAFANRRRLAGKLTISDWPRIPAVCRDRIAVGTDRSDTCR